MNEFLSNEDMTKIISARLKNSEGLDHDFITTPCRGSKVGGITEFEDCQTAINFDTETMASGDALSNNITDAFWETMARYYQQYNNIPDKIRIGNITNHDNNHWTSLVSEIPINGALKNQLKQAADHFKNTLDVQKTNTLGLTNYLKKCCKENNYNIAPTAEEYKFAPQDFKDKGFDGVNITHYDSLYPQGQGPYYKVVQASTAKLCTTLNATLVSGKCSQQYGMTCGDHSVWNVIEHTLYDHHPVFYDNREFSIKLRKETNNILSGKDAKLSTKDDEFNNNFSGYEIGDPDKKNNERDVDSKFLTLARFSNLIDEDLLKHNEDLLKHNEDLSKHDELTSVIADYDNWKQTFNQAIEISDKFYNESFTVLQNTSHWIESVIEADQKNELSKSSSNISAGKIIKPIKLTIFFGSNFDRAHEAMFKNNVDKVISIEKPPHEVNNINNKINEGHEGVIRRILDVKNKQDMASFTEEITKYENISKLTIINSIHYDECKEVTTFCDNIRQNRPAISAELITFVSPLCPESTVKWSEINIDQFKKELKSLIENAKLENAKLKNEKLARIDSNKLTEELVKALIGTNANETIGQNYYIGGDRYNSKLCFINISDIRKKLNNCMKINNQNEYDEFIIFKNSGTHPLHLSSTTGVLK